MLRDPKLQDVTQLAKEIRLNSAPMSIYESMQIAIQMLHLEYYNHYKAKECTALAAISDILNCLRTDNVP